MALHVVNEARRCLNCKVPQCRKGCPINTPIPDMIQLFLQNQLEAAGEMLFLNNPLSIVCSLVCDHEKQCEGHCVLGRKGMPVHISSIENYISDAYLDRLSPVLPASSGKRAAIIGSGPAGITIAVLLAQKGHDVTIFESRERIGGVLRYGIPAFRLPKTILDRYKTQLLKMGIHIRPNTSIGGALTVDDLQRDGYQAIFIGTGVWRPKKLGIPGESLGHVHFAIDYLVDPDVYDLGEHLAVIGAGNSAMDVARTALRKGTKKVSVLCRGPKAAASQREVDYAVADGVEFLSPVTMKSSAYRVKLILGLYIRPFLYLRTNLSFSKDSNPSSVILQSTVEIVPPCGVPSSVLWKVSPSMKPLFRNFPRISLSIGILSSSHSWLIWSKHPLMSPSKIQAGDVPRLRLVKQCSMASCTQRPLRNPYE